MRIFVWKGSWNNSEDLFRKIKSEFSGSKVSVEDLKLDPFVVVFGNTDRRNLERVRRMGVYAMPARN